MKQLVFIILIFVSYKAYNQNPDQRIEIEKNSYLFEGTIHGMDSGWIYIGHLDTTGKVYSYLDSSKILNSSFKFMGKIEGPEPCIFVFKPGPRSIHMTSYFILDKGYTTGLLYKDSMESSVIKGTNSQDQFRNFISKYNPTYVTQITLQTSIYKNPYDSNLLRLIKINEANQIDLINQSIKTNPASLVSSFIAEKYFPLNAEAKELETTYNSLQNKNNYYSKNFFKTLAAKNRTAIGHKVPEFSIIDKENIEINNKTFSGKYFLIDFWASWCVPCRKETPFLLKAYDLFHSKGFDIITISLDDRKALWEKALKEDKMPWKQACDFKVLKSPIVILFGVSVIPTNFLIDNTGNIVARDLIGDQLTKTLTKLLIE